MSPTPRQRGSSSGSPRPVPNWRCLTDYSLARPHRRHAASNAIRDREVRLWACNHLPSGRFAANAAWLAVQVIQSAARWTARIGLGELVVTTKTLRRRFFSLAGRLTR